MGWGYVQKTHTELDTNQFNLDNRERIMKYYSIILILLLLFIIPISSEAAEKNLVINISAKGDAKVIHILTAKSTISTIEVQPLSNKISEIVAIDDKGIILDTTLQGDSLRIDTLGVTYVKLSYNADIVTNDAGLWRVTYTANDNTFITLPPLANIVSMNNFPNYVENNSLEMPPGQISISYDTSDATIKEFSVYSEGTQQSVQIMTGSKIDGFIHDDGKILFRIDDNVPMIVRIPNSIISEPLQVSLNGESIEYQIYFQSSADSWLRIEPLESGTITITQQITEEKIVEEKIVEEKIVEETKGGGCLIATATFGSELAPQVQQLRELRDNHLLQTESGTSFIESFNDFYYSFSPVIADYERENPAFKEAVKLAITPMISSLSILNYVDMDSEVEVLGYGITLILLNVGIYIGIPAIVIIGIRKKF